ncbi:peptidase domain-containing ABC transporter [Paucibacter sp. DJ2R-2]|uniref:peptidase domain-containing ABC transporter n=1 Tax=Paucibacter sp. DJ2R-2 TaxID=2893558 RepID=UPI0021E51611|nr:peptidase domain-containing ABC transporter [Paucibacter sp. DJ2R-2]MCV2439847.1 peptidase domain-containing ABC transporter [Paucibacter sp. DJ2R-2]
MKKLPVILQGEATECGLACLAMVSAFWGATYTLPQLRSQFSPSLRGVNLGGITSIARALGFQCRALRTEPQNLREIRTPSILHWDLNHFVVLDRVQGEKFTIHDPKLGRRNVTAAELSQRFTGVVLELTGLTDQRSTLQVEPKLSLLRWLGVFDGFAASLATVLAFSAVLEIATLLAPGYLQTIIDSSIPNGDQDLVTVLGLVFLSLAVLQFALSFARSSAMSDLSFRLHHQWATRLFTHLVHLPAEYFQKRHVGDVVSRFRAIDNVQRVVSSIGMETGIDAAISVILIGVMFYYSAPLAAISLSGMTLCVLLRISVLSKMRRHSEVQNVAAAREISTFLETVRTSIVVKLLSLERRRIEMWSNAYVDATNGDVRVQRLSIVSVAGTNLILSIEQVAVVWLGAHLAIQGALSVGMLLAYLAYRAILMTRVRAVLEKLVELRLLAVDFDRLRDIVETEAENQSQSLEISNSKGPQAVEFYNVSFRYSSTDPWILRDVSFKIDAGESVALVGPSGCGKSTVAKLILGLLRPTSGEVLIDGRNIEGCSRSELYAAMAAVLQDDSLLTGSLIDNISSFDSGVDIARIEESAAFADIADDIVKMPMQYHTLVGDVGSSLSGGQRQRILLARALYRKPSLLVLDEATSHLDMQSESRVNESIRRMGSTRVIIAHRRETIASAGRVIELIKPGHGKSEVHQGRNAGVTNSTEKATPHGAAAVAET